MNRNPAFRPRLALGTVSLISAICLTCGCSKTPRFIVHVDALATPNANSARDYVLLPGNKGVSADDLQFREFCEYLDRALAFSGFNKVDKISEADVAIFASYGIGDPDEHVYSYSVPHFGQTGVSSSTTYGSVQAYGGGYGTFSSTTTYQPRYGITGYSSHLGTYVTYTRALTLVALEVTPPPRESDSLREVWQLSATSTGSSEDLRRVFPILVTAGQPYLGKSTGKQRVTVTLKENDEEVIRIRDGAEKNSAADVGP